jgi:predicted transcriptional regulator
MAVVKFINTAIISFTVAPLYMVKETMSTNLRIFRFVRQVRVLVSIEILQNFQKVKKRSLKIKALS